MLLDTVEIKTSKNTFSTVFMGVLALYPEHLDNNNETLGTRARQR